MRLAALSIAGLVFGLYASQANAQQSPQIDPRTLERVQQVDPGVLQQARERFQLAQPQRETQAPDYESGSGYEFNNDNELWYGWVNFDQARTNNRLLGRNINLSWREDAGGVRFETGERAPAILVRCGDGSNACPSAQTGSPDAIRAEGGTLRIDFGRAVSGVSLLVAPDRSVAQRTTGFIMEGWRDGDIVNQTSGEVTIFDSTLSGWTRLTLSGLASTDTRATTAAPTSQSDQTFDFVIVRAVNPNGAGVDGPIIVDSLRFVDRFGPAPFGGLGPRSSGLGDMLTDTRRLGGRLRQGAEVVRQGGLEDDRRYPVAQRMRMPIDVRGAEQGASRQRERVQLAVSLRARVTDRERSTIPLLAPLGVFRNEDPAEGLVETARYMGRENFYHLRFNTPYGPAVISGTRIVVIEPSQRETPGELEISTGYDGAFASFNLYGASYSVRLTCDMESVGQPCNDVEALETLLDRLFLFAPEAEG